ncbi:MAG TPA: isoprenylcysteine carboxylmethyltransferase family protein [Ruminiclostridium sp.]
MRELLSQGLFNLVIQAIICLCVFFLFLAIFIDFVLYSRKEQVQTEKKSFVETGTMTLFFIIFYLILQSGLGGVFITFGFLGKLLKVLGTLMIIIGCIANIYGRLNLGRNWANQVKIYQEQALVQTGMYKIVRHPLYASIILMFYGASLVYQNTVALVVVSVVFVPMMYYRAIQEENLLTQRFPMYNKYKQSTGMLFPKILKGRERI